MKEISTKDKMYAELRKEKERELAECMASWHRSLKQNPTEDEILASRAMSGKASEIRGEIKHIRLHQKFKKHIGVWIDELDASYSSIVFDGAIRDLEQLCSDYKYANELVNLIGRSYQELEMLIRGFFIKAGLIQKSNKKAAISTLLSEIDETDTFSKMQMIVLRQIIKLRNWVAHDIVKEERNYMSKHSEPMSGLVDMNEWTNYYYTKLVITKNMLHEAIDLFANYEGSALKNL